MGHVASKYGSTEDVDGEDVSTKFNIMDKIDVGEPPDELHGDIVFIGKLGTGPDEYLGIRLDKPISSDNEEFEDLRNDGSRIEHNPDGSDKKVSYFVANENCGLFLKPDEVQTYGGRYL